MTDPTVFFVTVMHGNTIKEAVKRFRTWGYFWKFEDAENCILKNQGDIFECGYYDLAVIEEMPQGVCPQEGSSHWYQAVFDNPREKDKCAVKKLPGVPKSFERTCNWSVG